MLVTGAAVEEVFFVFGVPLHHGHGRLILAAIFMIRANQVPPGLDAASKAFCHPQIGFGGGLAD